MELIRELLEIVRRAESGIDPVDVLLPISMVCWGKDLDALEVWVACEEWR